MSSEEFAGLHVVSLDLGTKESRDLLWTKTKFVLGSRLKLAN